MLDAACRADPAVYWRALPQALDQQLSEVHTHSCRCATVVLAIATRVSEHLEKSNMLQPLPQVEQGADGSTDTAALEQKPQQEPPAAIDNSDSNAGDDTTSSSSAASRLSLARDDGGDGEGAGDDGGAPSLAEIMVSCTKAALQFRVDVGLCARGQALLDKLSSTLPATMHRNS